MTNKKNKFNFGRLKSGMSSVQIKIADTKMKKGIKMLDLYDIDLSNHKFWKLPEKEEQNDK